MKLATAAPEFKRGEGWTPSLETSVTNRRASRRHDFEGSRRGWLRTRLAAAQRQPGEPASAGFYGLPPALAGGRRQDSFVFISRLQPGFSRLALALAKERTVQGLK
ncbi:MAG TPA: hypothetical protein PK867_20190, partial [Pirellulales bacterium]|nr:hypothetical protein [Pirellulales bacterium]